MRNTHGCASLTAVCGIELRCYDGAMKTLPHRNTLAPDSAGRGVRESLASSQGAMHPHARRAAPVIPHRRYPSLCDDGQPWFPRAPWSREAKTESSRGSTSPAGNPSGFPWFRVILLAGIGAIIAPLVATA